MAQNQPTEPRLLMHLRAAEDELHRLLQTRAADPDDVEMAASTLRLAIAAAKLVAQRVDDRAAEAAHPTGAPS